MEKWERGVLSVSMRAGADTAANVGRDVGSDAGSRFGSAQHSFGTRVGGDGCVFGTAMKEVSC